MVSGISNVGIQGGINTTTNARQYMAAPYQYAAQPDTVEIAGKKKGGKAGKTLLAAIGTALVAGVTLFGLVKSGKLKGVENPTKFTDKLQNWAFKGGTQVVKGVDYCTDKGKTLWEKVKGMFAKKDATTTNV